MRAALWHVSLVVTCGVFVGCETGSRRAANERDISRADFGERWPFTVEEGVLSCENNAVIFTTGGTAYAVNGVARGRGYAPTEGIWRESSLNLEVTLVVA